MYVGQNLRYSVGSVSFGDTLISTAETFTVVLGVGLGIALLIFLLGVVTITIIRAIFNRCKKQKPRFVTYQTLNCYIYNVHVHCIYMCTVISLFYIKIFP